MTAIAHATRSRLALPAIAACMLVAALLPSTRASAAEACPNEAVRQAQGSSYLPNCRGYELASPLKKNDQEVEVPEVASAEVPFEAALSGAASVYSTSGGLPGTRSAGLYGAYLASSSLLGGPWQSFPLAPESRFGINHGEGGPTGEFQRYSPALSCGIEETRLPQTAHPGEGAPLLAPGETEGESLSNIYAWNAPSNSYALVSNVKPDDPGIAPSVRNYMVAGVSADCRRAIFESEFQILGAPQLTAGGGPTHTLYEWSEGAPLRVASVLPDGTPATEVQGVKLGEEHSDYNELSSDGSRVFFTATADSGVDSGSTEVFLRERGTSTIEVSASQSESTPKDTSARFQAASADGHAVFFLASYGLASRSSAGAEAPTTCTANKRGLSKGQSSGCDLYVYNVEDHSLVDLSADLEKETGDTRGANVASVLGISEDGSVVSFAATGQLLPGMGHTQKEDEEKHELNVYLYDAAGSQHLHYVSRIKDEEAGLGSQTEALDTIDGSSGMRYVASRVSPNGSYLLFATRLKVREYNGEEYENSDREPPHAPDFESYEYSRASGSVTCVTCNPDRSIPPVARNVFGAYGSYVTNEQGYLRRNLLDSGQVLFDRFDSLVAQASNGTVNAYEWQPHGVGGCEREAGCVELLDSGTDGSATYFADASADGENVYVTTQARLAAQDEDGLRDLYDVRVGGGSLATATAGQCQGEACQGPLTGGIGASAHASESRVGGGNVSSSPPPGNGVQGFTAHSVKVTRHSTKRAALTLVILAPAGGRLIVSGSGVGTVKKSVAGAGSYTLKVSLSAKGKAAVKRKKRLRASVRVTFVPSSGAPSSTTVTVTFT